MSPTQPPRRLVRLVAVEADCHERTALRALVYGPDAVHGYALRERLRLAIARTGGAVVGDTAAPLPQGVRFGD